jgi:hypothetical protein
MNSRGVFTWLGINPNGGFVRATFGNTEGDSIVLLKASNRNWRGFHQTPLPPVKD